MAKMTKNQASKRLKEAVMKIQRVCLEGERHLSPSQFNKLLEYRAKIIMISNQLTK